MGGLWADNGEGGIDVWVGRRNRCNSRPAKLQEPVKPIGKIVGSCLCAPVPDVLVKVTLAAVANKNTWYNTSSLPT